MGYPINMASKRYKELTNSEKKTLKRLKKRKSIEKKTREKKPSQYIKFSSQLFGKVSQKVMKDEKINQLKKDLIKSNLEFHPVSYISMAILTTIISLFVGIALMIFFHFFSISPSPPLITSVSESFFSRIVKTIWLPLILPVVTFLSLYFYPSTEKTALGRKIDRELPFATIHMAAISGSLSEPSKIFRVMNSTEDYPLLKKEFNKILNRVNVHGEDLVSALRNAATNSSSQRLSELLNGIATSITSGGNLQNFFDKRAETLLLDYKLDKQKSAKSAETFMDIYISVVIAAPMILMLLLMIMKIGGLGLSLSNTAIATIVVLGVTMINIIFLVFLQVKQEI